MKRWITVEPQLAFASQKQLIGGREVNVFISPYNVPRAIRAEKTPDGKRLKFFFRYLDGEENPGSGERTSHDGVAIVRYGRSSGRVSCIEIDLIEAKVRSVRLRSAVEEAEKALEFCEQAEKSLSKRLNYQAASEALELSRPGLAAFV
jgi:hypothetical protein